MYIYYNPNPCGRIVGDCSVRAISAALGITWDEAHDILCEFSKNMCDMPSADQVWGAVLRASGFHRYILPDQCPDCYTVERFCLDHRNGIYVLGFGSHVATVIDGNLYDSWDSSQEVPVYYWYKH